MKKIFVLTGEPSGDKLASKVISQLKSSRSDIEYLSVGGEHLKSLGIKSLYDLKEVTYLGFTRVLLNIFKIRKKINETVKELKIRNPGKKPPRREIQHLFKERKLIRRELLLSKNALMIKVVEVLLNQKEVKHRRKGIPQHQRESVMVSW